MNDTNGKTNVNQDLIEILRAMATFLESHDLPKAWPHISINIPCIDRADFLARTRGVGLLTKRVSDYYFTLEKIFGDGCQIDWFVQRDEVCEKIVTKKIVPARPEMVLPAIPEQEVEEAVWVCPESLLASVAE